MLVIGRITKNAVVKQLKDEKQVVSFTVAVNDYYKPKNGEAKQFALFVNCSYWISTKIAANLVKGVLVEVEGRIFINAYKDMEGEARASMNCHVNKIKIHGSSKQVEKSGLVPELAQQPAGTDDLPF